MVFVKANYVTVMQPRVKKKKDKVVCMFRTPRKRIDEWGRLLFTWDDFYGEFIVEAFEAAKELKHRDVINIKRALVIVEGLNIARIKVFDYEMSKYQNLSLEEELRYMDKFINKEHLKFL